MRNIPRRLKATCKDPCPPPLAPLTSESELFFAISTPDPSVVATRATSWILHPPLLARGDTTPLPLAATEPVPAETDGKDAGAPPAAEREGAAASVSARTGSVVTSGNGVVVTPASNGG